MLACNLSADGKFFKREQYSSISVCVDAARYRRETVGTDATKIGIGLTQNRPSVVALALPYKVLSSAVRLAGTILRKP